MMAILSSSINLMWTKEAIEKFMAEINFTPGSAKSEIKELPNILHPTEKLCGLLKGWLKKVHNREINGSGLVIATDKRIIFYRKSIIGTVTKEEIPISKVSSSSFRKGLLSCSVAIVTSNNEAVIEQCFKEEAQRFADTVQRMIADIDGASDQKIIQNNSEATAANNMSNLDQLEKLFDLKQKGILSEEEFLTQKAKLLG